MGKGSARESPTAARVRSIFTNCAVGKQNICSWERVGAIIQWELSLSKDMGNYRKT